MNEMKEGARKNDVSIYITRQDVIDLSNKLEPEVDHSGLKGKSLLAAQKRYHISMIKYKRQLIKANEKSAREEAAVKI
jgi:hypothetical protein